MKKILWWLLLIPKTFEQKQALWTFLFKWRLVDAVEDGGTIYWSPPWKEDKMRGEWYKLDPKLFPFWWWRLWGVK
jgi:hypothetical protein